MDFELKSLSVAQAAQSAVDALIVLVPDDIKTVKGDDPLAELIRDVSRRGIWKRVRASRCSSTVRRVSKRQDWCWYGLATVLLPPCARP